MNDSYLIDFTEKFNSTKVHFFGLVDYLITENESNLASKLGHELSFFDPFAPEQILSQLKTLLEKCSEHDEKSVILLDLEVLSSKEFPGRSSVSIDGLDQLTVVKIVKLLAEHV